MDVRERKMEEERNKTKLIERCIAHILSYTTPEDACRLSLVCKAFYSAAESDAVWDLFIPSDFASFVPSSSFSSSKKTQYLALCDHPIIIDQGRRSFQLDKRTGKKSYMLGARDLYVVWGGSPQYWDWIAVPESRFRECAKLVSVCWFEIFGRISTDVLSSNTKYAAFLVYKMIDAHGFDYDPVEISMDILGGDTCTKNVCLDPNLDEGELDDRFQGLQRPNVRNDGWLEIEMGEFFNSGVEDRLVDFRVKETTSLWWKRGFFLEGIELRPKLPIRQHKNTRPQPRWVLPKSRRNKKIGLYVRDESYK